MSDDLVKWLRVAAIDILESQMLAPNLLLGPQDE
jgi:hypothetical protein